MRKVILYVHGKGGSHLEVNMYKKSCDGFQIVGVDYNDYVPWIAKKQIQHTYQELYEAYDEIYLMANSIGAYLAMDSLQNCEIKKALFISPVVNMEALILDMMSWAKVTEEQLKQAKEIQTDFDETLSWEYLVYVRSHPITWNVNTEILYAQKDYLVSRLSINEFIENHDANLCVMEHGEHWFHTEEQLMFLNAWLEKTLRK